MRYVCILYIFMYVRGLICMYECMHVRDHGKRRVAMSLVGWLLKLLSCLVIKLLSVLSSLLVE